MKKHLFSVAFWAVSLSGAFAQAPDIQWQKSLGGTSEDIALSVAQTTDGGYILVGWSWSDDGDVTSNHGGSDYWIVKLDALGNMQWQKNLGGTSIDYASSVVQTSDGGYVVAGYSYSNDGDVTSNHGGTDYWIVKLDVWGGLQWQKSLGGSSVDWPHSVVQTSDGGYIVAGVSDSNDGDVSGNHGDFDYWIVKLDASGNIQWQKSLGGTKHDEAYSIAQTSDGGYIVAGISSSNNGDVTDNHGYLDYWIVKLDVSGSILWQKSLGGIGHDFAQSIVQTSDGGYIVAGISSSAYGNHGWDDCWIVKLNFQGLVEWQKSFGGASGDFAHSVTQTSDGGYIFAGVSISNDGDITGNHGGNDYWTVKLDPLGNIQWQKSLGGSSHDWAYSVMQTSDEGYIIAGFSDSNDGDVTGNHGNRDYWIVKLSPMLTGVSEWKTINSLAIYPNPAKDQVTIQVSPDLMGDEYILTDFLGRKVTTGMLDNETTTFSIKGLAAGIYTVQFGKHRNQSLKLMKK